jgi:FlaA1/EpsC-like NDP-sugar epimerase
MGAVLYATLEKDNNNYNVFGFIDDNSKKVGMKINRLPILAPKTITAKFVHEHKIQEIIIAIRALKPERILEIVDLFYKLDVEVKIAPLISRWINGDLNLRQIKQIRIEDLLERIPIDLNNAMLAEELKDKRILVTGASGSIGSEISRQLTTYPCQQLLLLDQSESELYNLQQELKLQKKTCFKVQVADVRDKQRMEVLFQTFKPDLVFHAAAYKHVPLMEENPYEAVKINVGGTKNIADLSFKHQVEKFVMVSTDKAVNPTNVMGATKRVAEMYVTSMNALKGSKTKFITTRFGNVLGSNGSVIPLFKKQIEAGGPLTLTHKEITRYFMTIPEACQLVLEAAAMGKGGEIFLFDMGTSVKIYDLAVRMIQLSGLRYPDDIEIEITGLRPGEKLYEELLNDEENTLPTHHKKITIAQVRNLNVEQTIALVDKLCVQNKVQNVESTVNRIKEIVPEYISENSVFSSLDILSKTQ